jgi:hypothetical protein
MRARYAMLVLACVGALALSACGAGDRAPDAASVAERFQTSLEAEDGAAACAELSEETVSALEREEEKPCDEAILTLDLPRGERARDTTAYVTSAAVTLSDGSAAFLDEGPDGWKVAAAGCRPAGDQKPFECELEN